MSSTNNVQHILRGIVEDGLITIDEEVIPGKGFTSLQPFIIYEERIKKAKLLPGDFLPEFEEVGEESPSSGREVVIRMITDSRGKLIQMLWVYRSKFDEMVTKMLSMPLYKMTQSSSGFEWIGRDIKRLRNQLAIYTFANALISYGIKIGDTKLFKDNGKAWKPLLPNQAISLLGLGS